MRWSREYNERRNDHYTERLHSDGDEADWESMEEAQGARIGRQPPGRRTPGQCTAEDNARSARVFMESLYLEGLDDTSQTNEGRRFSKHPQTNSIQISISQQLGNCGRGVSHTMTSMGTESMEGLEVGGLPTIGLALGESEREEERGAVQMNIDSEDEGGQEDEGAAGGNPEEVEEDEEGRTVEGRLIKTKRKQNILKNKARADKRRRQAVEKRMREINEEAIVEI